MENLVASSPINCRELAVFHRGDGGGGVYSRIISMENLEQLRPECILCTAQSFEFANDPAKFSVCVCVCLGVSCCSENIGSVGFVAVENGKKLSRRKLQSSPSSSASRSGSNSPKADQVEDLKSAECNQTKTSSDDLSAPAEAVPLSTNGTKETSGCD